MGKGTFNCVKWLLTVFNFVFIVCGLTISALGVWILVAPSTVADHFGSGLTPILSYILLGTGGLIVLISFCGCAGAGLENRCLLCLFFTVLCGIFVACLVAVILISVFRRDLSQLASDKMKTKIIQNYGSDQSWTDFMDKVQSWFQCCGIDDNSGVRLYQKTPWYKDKRAEKVPFSCCEKFSNGQYKNKEQCQRGVDDSMNTKGCMRSIVDILWSRYLILLIVLVVIGVLLICGMVLSLVHLRNIINNPYYEYSQPI